MAPEAPNPAPQCALLLNKPSPPKSREKLSAAFPSFQMRNNSEDKLLSWLRLLAETHPTYSRAQVLTKNTQNFLVFSVFTFAFSLFFLPLVFLLSISQENKRWKTEQSCFWKTRAANGPKRSLWMGGVKDGRGLVELVQRQTLGQVERGKGLPLPPLAFCVGDLGQWVAVIAARCLARVYWAGRSAVPLIRGCALNWVLWEYGGGWAWCSTVLKSNRLEQIASWPITLWHFLHTFKLWWTRKCKHN